MRSLFYTGTVCRSTKKKRGGEQKREDSDLCHKRGEKTPERNPCYYLTTLEILF